MFLLPTLYSGPTRTPTPVQSTHHMSLLHWLCTVMLTCGFYRPVAWLTLTFDRNFLRHQCPTEDRVDHSSHTPSPCFIQNIILGAVNILDLASRTHVELQLDGHAHPRPTLHTDSSSTLSSLPLADEGGHHVFRIPTCRRVPQV